MEILKAGRDPSTDQFLGTCLRCDAKYRAERRELKEFLSSDKLEYHAECLTDNCYGTVWFEAIVK